MTTGTVATRKKATVMKYLNTGNYRRVRLIDDDIHNLMIFLSIKDNLSQELIDKVKSKYSIKDDETIAPIEFYALQVVDSEGKLKLIRSQVSETTAIGSIGYAGEELGAVGSFGGPDNGISDDPIVMFDKDNVKTKRFLASFIEISTQEDWDSLFSSFWRHDINVERRTSDQELDEDVVDAVGPGTLGADVAVPDALIGGNPGEAPSMTRRLEKKKKKKRKTLEDLINSEK